MKKRIIFSKLIRFVYSHTPSFARKHIESYLSHAEGGWYFSETIRDIYKEEYGLSIGIGSYGCFVPARFPKGTIIGNYCSIARNVTVLNANHPMERASMHPLFYDSKLGASNMFSLERKALTIGHDVWIGQDVIITKGCTHIGNGAVIGAGSIVTKDIAPYDIVAGNPARIIRRRFNDEIIKELEESHWYELSPEQLQRIADSVDVPLAFAKKARQIAQ